MASGPFKLGSSSGSVKLSKNVNKVGKSVNKAINKEVKAASKQLKKAAKKAKKKAKKITKDLKRSYAKSQKEKNRVYDKRKRQIERLAVKAANNNEIARKRIQELKNEEYEVDYEDIIEITSKRIQNLRYKDKPTEKDLEKMKEYASSTMYDNIKVKMELRDKDKKGISVVKPVEVAYGDLRKALNKQVKNPAKLTSEQSQIIQKYGKTIDNYDVVDLDTDEQKDSFIKAFNISRDVSIGGNSTLINDLSYTFDALWIGRDFVQTIQDIMSDPQAFVKIEAWYRSNTSVQYKVQQATEGDWYAGYTDFSAQIMDFIDNMPDTFKDVKDKLSVFREKLEVKAEQKARG